MGRPGQTGSSGPARRAADPLLGSVGGWLDSVATRGGELGRLLAAPPADQVRLGYAHTAREIAHQPATWLETAAVATACAPQLGTALARVREPSDPGAIVLTGSGSSLFAGECLAPILQQALRLPIQAVGAGDILTHPAARLPPRGPVLLVSFGRSGNSPESCAVIDALLETTARCHHLVVTCNRLGRMATRYRGHPRVTTLVLDDKTHDQSLVMTSSVTNMVLAAALLARLDDLEDYHGRAHRVARAAAELLLARVDPLAQAARGEFRAAVYLGSGPALGAAREAALKMLEMTGGEVLTMPETYLGLRHGPMCAVDRRALAVCFLSYDPVVRAYEADLVNELRRKGLADRLVLVGPAADGLAERGDVAVELPEDLDDGDAVLLDVLVGQLLAFFRCRHLGLSPDQPSDDGVISRVVEGFAIHAKG